MDWIKAKYDRLLLGVFGVIAILVGGLLIVKVLGFKNQFSADRPHDPKEDFGKDDKSGIAAAKVQLAAPAAFVPPVLDGKQINLFASAPILKLSSDEVIAILDKDAKQARPPLPNKWIYENDLDFTRQDLATADADKDGYTNQEEFEGGSNPRDKSSTPGIQSKVEYKEVVKDPMTLKFNTFISDKDFQFRRTEPAAKAFNTEHLKVGDSFPAERGGTPRFKVTSIKPKSGTKNEIAVLDDLLTKDVEAIEIEYKATLEMPARRAKVACHLGKEEEKIVPENEEFSFEADPETKFNATKITDEELTLEITAPGKEKVTKTYKIPPPP